MRYLAAWLLFVTIVAYFTAGLGTLWLLRDVIGMDPEQADRIAKYSFVGTTALLALSPLWLLRGKPYVPALDVLRPRHPEPQRGTSAACVGK